MFLLAGTTFSAKSWLEEIVAILDSLLDIFLVDNTYMAGTA